MIEERYRIATKLNQKNKYLNIKLEQSYSMLDVLSLSLNQTDQTVLANAGYGVVVGRVSISQVGIPNAKVSVFIPIDPNETPDNAAVYPYSTVRSQDASGKRYNLLTKIRRWNPFSTFPPNASGIGASPKVPVGTMPDKVEVLANGVWREVFPKYYKYTTTTNQSGDYMLFCPAGAQTMFVDCDISDIGRFSTTYAVMSHVQGLPPESFNNNGTLLEPSNDLSTLPNIQSQTAAVYVRPFWGDSTSGQQIGITRQDFKLNAKLLPSFTIFGSSMTTSKDSWWGDIVILRLLIGLQKFCFSFPCAITVCFKLKIIPNLHVQLDPTQSDFGVSINFTYFDASNTFYLFPNNWTLSTIFPFIITDGSCNTYSCNDCSDFVCFSLKVDQQDYYIPCIIPYINIQSIVYNRCTVNGGVFDLPPFVIKWLGCLNCCYDVSNGVLNNNQDNLITNCGLQDKLTTKLNIECFYHFLIYQ